MTRLSGLGFSLGSPSWLLPPKFFFCCFYCLFVIISINLVAPHHWFHWARWATSSWQKRGCSNPRNVFSRSFGKVMVMVKLHQTTRTIRIPNCPRLPTFQAEAKGGKSRWSPHTTRTRTPRGTPRSRRGQRTRGDRQQGMRYPPLLSGREANRHYIKLWWVRQQRSNN